VDQTYISGRLGRDAESKATTAGDITKFSVAVGYGKKDNRKTMWYDVVTWHGTAIACKGLKKGDAVIVVGKLRINEWTDRDGVKRRTWSLQADTVGKVLYVKESKSQEESRESTNDDPAY